MLFIGLAEEIIQPTLAVVFEIEVEIVGLIRVAGCLERRKAGEQMGPGGNPLFK